MDITQRAGDLQVPATSQTSCAAGVADVQLVLAACPFRSSVLCAALSAAFLS